MIANKIENQFKYFSFLSTFYTTLLIASVLSPYKIIDFFGYDLPGGIFIFPLTYLLGGMIAEVYGKKLALNMVYSGIGCLIIFNLIITSIIQLPSSSTAPNQHIFMQAFGNSMRLSLGCLIGLICSDVNNIYRISKLKMLFRGKYFIQRCLWATGISEGIFNVITYSITYYNIISNSDILKLIINSWCLKMIYSLMMIIPILKLMEFIKKSEGINSYDIDVKNQKYHSYDLELILANLLQQKRNLSLTKQINQARDEFGTQKIS